jgi:hypothetical protein
VGHVRGVVACVEDDQDVAVARLPAAHLDQIDDHPADLGGGDLGDIVGRPQPQCVQDLAPGGPARFQRGGGEGYANDDPAPSTVTSRSMSASASGSSSGGLAP